MARRVHWPQWKRWHPEDLAVALAIAIGLMLGLSGFNHYGASWDEAGDFHYAKASLAAYHSRSPDYSLLPKGDFVELHGPAYLMASEVMATWWTSIRAGWPMLDARHFNNHISFLVGLVSLYLLTVRLAGRRAALGAFALMATQPLLMGHSFINQKDTPFMALFLASVAAGVLCSSSSTGTRISASSRVRSVSALARASWRAARQDWRSATRRRRTLFACVVLAAVAVSGGVLLVYPTLPLAVQLIILRAHAGESSTWINALFDLIAANAAQVAAWSYVGKAARIYARLRPLIVVLAWIPAFFAGRMVFPSLRLPGNLRFPWTGMGKPRLGLAVALGAAGALLGVTISVRSLGVFAGVLVTLLLLLEKRPPLVGILVYWAAAALACFGTWPYLWDDPIGGFVDSLRVHGGLPLGGHHPVRGSSMVHGRDALDDVLIRVTVHNRGPEAARLHLLPTLWFRNTWSWKAGSPKPNLREVDGAILAWRTRSWASTRCTARRRRHRCAGTLVHGK